MIKIRGGFIECSDRDWNSVKLIQKFGVQQYSSDKWGIRIENHDSLMVLRDFYTTKQECEEHLVGLLDLLDYENSSFSDKSQPNGYKISPDEIMLSRMFCIGRAHSILEKIIENDLFDYLDANDPYWKPEIQDSKHILNNTRIELLQLYSDLCQVFSMLNMMHEEK